MIAIAKPKAKPALGLLVGVGKEPDGDEVESEDDAETMAFQGLRKAMETGDDAAGVSALKTFLEACGYTSKAEPVVEEV